jgi:hypothetical protein
MERDVTTPPPEGLRDAGEALWTNFLGDVGEGWALDARELHLLRQACRCADELAELESAVDDDGVVVRGSRGQARPRTAEARR